ncbi:MAG: peptidase M23 [Flavobacteriales bacterium]|nr:peptidase M23 [Flavobacteriales bacterium]|tara:strand:+ start:3562 stop:4533 length:972 start_codon:yes stop_codon:yes gene_type:complete
MAKIKYYYDKKTLSYKRIKLSGVNKIKRILYFLSISIISGLIMLFIFFNFFDSPKEIMLKRELSYTIEQYELLNSQLNQVELVLDDLQRRDDNIYRVIFEAEPIASSIRKAGFGGVNRYKHLEGMKNTELVLNTTKKIDQISKQLYIQTKSFDEIALLAKDKSNMLAALPAIQPVSNKDLSRMASGFGPRIHPIYKTKKFHYGMDFSAKTGTPIYATGNGRIEKVRKSRRGFGNHVIINHGYGYKTLYAHMKKYIVKKGQKVKRGEIIGYVGNTGTSVAPHLHYEVHKNGKKLDPVNFYYEDLNAEEYEKMIFLSSQPNQSFD